MVMVSIGETSEVSTQVDATNFLLHDSYNRDGSQD